ncbi:MAG: alpha-amylase family glycosyl hydrolase [Polyangiaceae bacterium]
MLADLGVNVLHLTPVHEGASNHRYDFVDPTKVDPALGGDAAFARLVEDAHSRDMRILLDFSFVHAGAGFPRAEDVMLHGRSSEWAAWFLWDDEGALRHYGKRKDAPLVDLTHPEVADWVVSLAEAWARRGVDGFRLDMAAEVPLELAERVRTTLRRWRPESVVLGEVVPAHAHRWTTAGAVDAATDFGFHGAVTAWLAEGRTDAAAFVRTWRSSARLRGTPESAAVRFLSTHDHVRFESLAMRNGRTDRVPVGLVLLATVPGVPMLLYGEETGMGHDARELAPENVWADRAPRPWSDAVHARHALLRSLFRLRKEHRALRGGSFEFVHDGEDVLVYRRRAGRDVVDVVLHAGAGTRTLSLEDETFPNARVAVVSGDATFEGGSATLRGPGALVLVRDDTRERGTTRVHLVRANEVRKDRAFVHGDVRPAALPVRLDFAVTERCNLRCVHCITNAPERTANGSARTLSRAVLDALAPDLAFARYFGFVHGGESLTAPVFFDVLRTIREARGAEPTVVHLLSNGVLLHERNLHRLFDAGVNSLSVSLDGATAATNDVLRVGGKLEAILANVAAAVRIRAERNIDVRLGISTVVMPANVDELRELVDRAVDVGVDWVKLEELVPVNAFSRKALPDYDAANVRSAILRAAEHGRARGIRMVEHVGAPDVWRCRLDARTEAFLADDEFANRSSIHPCRARWDIACIEPDGDVRIGDFFGRVLGNVLHAPLDELWRSSVAADERRASQVGRLCGPTGPVTCVDGG